MTTAAQREETVPRYRPLLELGRGGMARVYLAESTASGLRKLVVLKVLNQELAADPEMRVAFMREAEISARLNHPNIVNVHEVFEQGGTALMVMQHLDGMALSDIISRLQGQVPLKLHLHILCQLLDALHYFHELKSANGDSLECVHRDVSPHNVMVLHEGGVKIVDFGVAKIRTQSESHTRTGVIKGKVSYMAPEQLLACSSVDRRADIYSVGVMLWEAAAGHRMWGRQDSMQRMSAILRGELPKIREAAPGVSDALARIIERALALTPDMRFATAEEMQIELEEIAHTEGGHSLPRELTEFMRVNFGGERRERQRAIDKAFAQPEGALPDISWNSWALARGPGQAPETNSASGVGVALDSLRPTPQRWRRSLVRAVVVAVVCALVGVVTWSSTPGRPHAVHAKRAPSSNEPGASVRQPATTSSNAPAVATNAEAIGAGTETVTFVPAPAAPPLVDTTTAELAETTSADLRDARRGPNRPHRLPARAGVSERAKPEVAPAPTNGVSAASEKQSTPAEAGGESCNPPYRLDASGVRVFKPQCL